MFAVFCGVFGCGFGVFGCVRRPCRLIACSGVFGVCACLGTRLRLCSRVRYISRVRRLLRPIAFLVDLIYYIFLIDLGQNDRNVDD